LGSNLFDLSRAFLPCEYRHQPLPQHLTLFLLIVSHNPLIPRDLPTASLSALLIDPPVGVDTQDDRVVRSAVGNLDHTGD